MSALRTHRRKIFNLLAWVPVGIWFTQQFFTVITIKGTSMQPTFNPTSTWRKDVVLLNRYVVNVDVTRIQRGDVITLWDPTTPGLLITKRVLALSGDVVRTLPPYPDHFVRVPPMHLWVEGDESFRSADSNHFGPVSLSLVHARVDAVLWPLRRARWLGGVWREAAEERVAEGKGKAAPAPALEGNGNGNERANALPLMQGKIWSEFRAEQERARARMQRVFVQGGRGSRAAEERWRRGVV